MGRKINGTLERALASFPFPMKTNVKITTDVHGGRIDALLYVKPDIQTCRTMSQKSH